MRITRAGHPFAGRTLQVMKAMRQRGMAMLLVVLPDGTRSLIPAAWSDWTAAEDAGAAAGCGAPPAQFVTLGGLLQLRRIVDALLLRGDRPRPESGSPEEDAHAAGSCTSRHPQARETAPTLDAAARAAALEILARLIAKALETSPPQKESGDE